MADREDDEGWLHDALAVVMDTVRPAFLAKLREAHEAGLAAVRGVAVREEFGVGSEYGNDTIVIYQTREAAESELPKYASHIPDLKIMRRLISPWLPVEPGVPSGQASTSSAPEIWISSPPPGGYVCATCGEPTESEPCPIHARPLERKPRPMAEVMKFRKKPVVIESVRFTGDNHREALSFIYPEMSEDGLRGAEVMRLPVVIETLEGDMTVSPGDWVIKGVQGEFYPCKPDIFEATYEPVGASIDDSTEQREAGSVEGMSSPVNLTTVKRQLVDMVHNFGDSGAIAGSRDRERAGSVESLSTSAGQVGICGAESPRLIGRSVCALPAEHGGWHRDDVGMSWSVRAEAADAYERGIFDAGERAGYERAIEVLRDEARYSNWWTSLPQEDPMYGYWQSNVRQHLADYLTAIEQPAPRVPETNGPDHPKDVGADRCPARRTCKSGAVIRCTLHRDHALDGFGYDHWGPGCGSWEDDDEDAIDLRDMLFGGWTGEPAQEEAVTAARDAAVRALLHLGRDVVCDDTNLVTRLERLAGEEGAMVEIWDLTTVPIETCINRDAARKAAGGRFVGEPVIRKMAELITPERAAHDEPAGSPEADRG